MRVLFAYSRPCFPFMSSHASCKHTFIDGLKRRWHGLTHPTLPFSTKLIVRQSSRDIRLTEVNNEKIDFGVNGLHMFSTWEDVLFWDVCVSRQVYGICRESGVYLLKKRCGLFSSSVFLLEKLPLFSSTKSDNKISSESQTIYCESQFVNHVPRIQQMKVTNFFDKTIFENNKRGYIVCLSVKISDLTFLWQTASYASANLSSQLKEMKSFTGKTSNNRKQMPTKSEMKERWEDQITLQHQFVQSLDQKRQ
jgi:hypothetical protein